MLYEADKFSFTSKIRPIDAKHRRKPREKGVPFKIQLVKMTATSRRNNESDLFLLQYDGNETDKRRRKHRKMQQQRSLQDPVDKNDTEEADEPTRPLSYWDDLRNSSTFETQSGSAVFRVNTGSKVVRLAHVLSIHPYSEVLANGTRVPVNELVHVEAAAFLAIMHHFNERFVSLR